MRRAYAMDRLKAMQAFVQVVDSGSFSAAARRLNVGQPALSKSIAQLEDRLGVKLLGRTTHGLAATEAGLNFYERARRSIEEADEAELAARGAGSGLAGKLCVSAAVTFARIHLMPRLPEFLAQHPDLEMEVVLDDRHIDLVREGIDVGLRMGKLADSSLTARRIASCRRVVFGTPTYFERAGVPTTPGDLATHQAVIYGPRGGGAIWPFRREGVELTVTLHGQFARQRGRGFARAVFEVLDVAADRDPALAARLARGVFAQPGSYPATVRFGNSDPLVKSDQKADVRSLSFSVDLTRGGLEAPAQGVGRQDFSMQNASTLPINDAKAFLATMKVLTAANPLKGLAS
jgi:DNA-binding transcriptional LysR family regulator